MPFTKSGSFGWAGGGKAGALVDLWDASRFMSPPALDDPPPVGVADYGPVTTGPEFGNPGAFIITGITDAIDYYIRAQYAGHQYWGFSPASTLGGETPGGGGGGVQIGGDLGGDEDTPLVIGLQGTPVEAAAPFMGQILSFNGTNWTPINPPDTGVQIGGDIGGTESVPLVTGLQGRQVPNTAPSSGQLLGWSGTAWVPTSPAASGGGTISNVTTSTPLTVTLTNPTGPTLGIAVTGGGGGGAGSLLSQYVSVTHDSSGSPGYATGFGSGYTPTVGDALFRTDLVITTAYVSTYPAYMDFGTLTGGTFKGLLADLGLPPIPLSAADADLPNNAGWLSSKVPIGPGASGSQSAGLSDAIISGAFSPGTLFPVLRTMLLADSSNEMMIIISQDGTAAPATSASLAATSVPTPVPSSGTHFVVNTSNNEFVWTPQAIPGAGLATPVQFTVASGSYASPTTLINALNAAVNSTPTAFSPTFGTFSYDSGTGLITVTAAGSGFGAGSLLGQGVNDITGFDNTPPGNDLGFGGAGLLVGGTGGDPLCSAGASTLIFTASSPTPV